MKNVLLMSATITPPQGVPALARTDPDLRRADYEEALSFYVGLLGKGLDGVVFAENSGSDLTSLRRTAAGVRAGGSVEFLSIPALDQAASRGRAYGEFRLLDDAMSGSELVAGLGPGGTVWKVTGRYVVRNLARVVARRPPGADVYCNLRNVPQHWADMYLMGWSKSGHAAVVRGAYQEFDEESLGRPPEVRWREMLDDARARGDVRIVPRFTVTPDIVGRRGGDNRSYRSATDGLKNVARATARHLAPSLWL